MKLIVRPVDRRTNRGLWWLGGANAAALLALAALVMVRSPDPPPPTPPPSLRQRAEAGDLEATVELADRLHRGDGVARNEFEAATWYARAADSGHMASQVTLAGMYQRGDGVPTDLDRSRELFQEAADAGDPDAMVQLAQMEPPVVLLEPWNPVCRWPGVVTHPTSLQRASPAPAPEPYFAPWDGHRTLSEWGQVEAPPRAPELVAQAANIYRQRAAGGDLPAARKLRDLLQRYPDLR